MIPASNRIRMRRPLICITLIPVLFFSVSLCLFAQEEPRNPEQPDYSTLLEKYLEHDAESRRLELVKEQAALKLRQYALEKGVSFTVSTGDVNFTFNPNGTVIDGRPGLEVNIPRLGDFALTLNAPVSVKGGGGETPVGIGVDAGLRAGIITGRRDEEKALLLENEFAFRQALWNVARRKLAAEQEFCAAIKELLTLRNTMIEAQADVLSARYDLETKKAGGYGASSVIIRTAELKLRRQERIRDEAERKIERALGKFAANCGVDHAQIPEDIPNADLTNVSASDASFSVDLEKLKRQQDINTLKRKAQDNFFTLSGSLGYVWENNPMSGYIGTGNEFIPYSSGSSIKAGAGIGLGGLTLNTSVRLPLEIPSAPSLSVGIQWRSYGFKVFNINRQMRSLDAEQEQNAIVQAEKDFRDKAEDFNRRMVDLEWQYGIILQETELFRINAEEQQSWFNRGIVRELDYLDARNQYLLALNSLLSAKIDRRLYNIEAALLFVPEGH